MLRVKREKEDVRFLLVRKERRFSPNLLKGFGIALVFHVLFLVVFRVVSPTPTFDGEPRTPSSVVIDLGTTQPIKEAPSFVQLETPTLYQVTLPGVICSLESDHEFLCYEPDFSEIEAFEYIPLEVDFDHD
ncbi:MAG: hypothetical protein H7A36_04550 [Chlamydiales bacterium]|nr:hypothetical protein [Chlamydiales bacterium]